MPGPACRDTKITPGTGKAREPARPGNRQGLFGNRQGPGTGKACSGTGKACSGTGKACSGTGKACSGTGNRQGPACSRHDERRLERGRRCSL